MPILPILLYGNEILRTKANFVEKISNEEIKMIEKMFKTMSNASGIGLAANQIGVLKQILIVDISSLDEEKDFLPLVVINPKIISETGKTSFEEGCLSIPEVRENIMRAEKIELEYQNIKLEKKRLSAEGIFARVLLHEIDHLNGILFIDKISATKKTLIKSKLRKISKGEIVPSYPFKLK